MRMVSADPTPVIVPPGTEPDYNTSNPLMRLASLFERCQVAAEREHYAHDLLQVLLPIQTVTLYGPRSPNESITDAARQDFVDFQKQNVQDFTLGDSTLMRGWVTVGLWTGPFLRISYRGGPDSELARASRQVLGAQLRLFLKVGDVATKELLHVPYNAETDRYEIEIWSYAGSNLREQLDAKGRAAFDRGELIARADLVQGSAESFDRTTIEGRAMPSVEPNHALHPIRTLRVELAWADHSLAFWDSRAGANYVYEFSMVVRGWDHYLKVGGSLNPHGGIGRLEFRNLLSNYFEFAGSSELGREVSPWSFDAFHGKAPVTRREPFLAVDYIDLHIVRPNGGIGLHRHRDNQEIFMVLENESLMIIGDWCEMPSRMRAFEIRMLRAGHFALLKPGQLHGLLNPTDEDIPLLMFGGYD